MASSAKDIQFRELKDTISQLNTTLRTQNDLIVSLQKMLEERNAKDDERDWIISNLQAQLEYFKQKLFDSASERRSDMPGQMNLFFGYDSEEEPFLELIEPEFIEVKNSERGRKPKVNYNEMFANLLIHYEEMDTLTDEEIRTELRYTKAKLERIVCVVTTYSSPVCKDTEEPQFIKDEGVPALIPDGYIPSPLVSHIVYEKYIGELPLYRQKKGFGLL